MQSVAVYRQIWPGQSSHCDVISKRYHGSLLCDGDFTFPGEVMRMDLHGLRSPNWRDSSHQETFLDAVSLLLTFPVYG